MRLAFLFIVNIFFVVYAIAQTADSSTIANKPSELLIKYINSDSLVGIVTDGNTYNKLYGNVILEHNGTTLSCDSAFFYQESNFVEAFSNVVITTNNGANITCGYLKYTGNNNNAILKNNVLIVDGNNQLNSEYVTYNTKTKIANYTTGGTLVNDNTLLSSKIGKYNGITKDAYFKGDVVVTDPKYSIESVEMKYNTIKKFVHFLGQSTIVTDNATIEGKKGTYDAIKEIGDFKTRSTVSNEEQQIVANYLYHDEKKGISNAKGNVVIDDYKNKRKLLADKVDYNAKTGIMLLNKDIILYDVVNARTLFADKAYYNKKAKYTRAEGNVWVYDSIEQTILNCNNLQINQYTNTMLAKQKPVIRMLADKDSLFMRADSFFIAPYNVIDTLKKMVVTQDTIPDSVANEKTDTTAIKRILIGIGAVKIFGDSMQAIADSMAYSQMDSVFRLFKKPILWSNGNQAIADTIWIITENNKLKQMKLIANASLISVDTSSGFYDQVYGSQIDGFLKDNELDRMFVDGNAESLYFNKNDKGEYMGSNKTKSAQMQIILVDKKVSRISFYTEPEGVFTPMNKVTDGEKKLEKFIWQESLKPKNKLDVTNY